MMYAYMYIYMWRRGIMGVLCRASGRMIHVYTLYLYVYNHMMYVYIQPLIIQPKFGVKCMRAADTSLRMG